MFALRIRAVENRARMSAGITSAQYFNHCRGTSDFEVKDVQSRMTSKLRDRYTSNWRVLIKI